MVHEFKRDLLLGTLLVPVPRVFIYGSSRLFYGESPAKLPSKGNKQSEAIKTYSTACSILEPDFSSEAEVEKSTRDLISRRDKHLHTNLEIILSLFAWVPSSS